jgi:hypothetical protein
MTRARDSFAYLAAWAPKWPPPATTTSLPSRGISGSFNYNSSLDNLVAGLKFNPPNYKINPFMFITMIGVIYDGIISSGLDGLVNSEG